MRRALIVACVVAASALAGAPGAPASGQPTERIVGGLLAPSLNFTVAITQHGRFTCSGSVIAPTRVLTAAHCALDPSGLAVIAGRTRIGDPSTGEVIGVTAAAIHPDYLATRAHDLAILTLAQPTTAPPVPLATPEESAAFLTPGRRVGIAGFGRQNPLRFGRPRVGVLRAVTVFVFGPRLCKRLYRQRFKPFAMICTFGRSIQRTIVGRGACQGDSGGPLVLLNPNGALTQYGVASFVAGGRGPLAALSCALLGSSVYVRTADAMPFIGSNLPAATP